MKLNINDLRQLLCNNNDLSTIDELVGKNVFIRTLTHHYTGQLYRRDDMFIKLEKAAWIADDGRFHKAMQHSSNFAEVEPYTKPIRVNLYSILDICELSGPLPCEVKE